MSSILLHNVTENTDELELILLFEKHFKNIELLHIEVSHKFESAIAYFQDENSAKEILANCTQMKLDDCLISLKLSNQIYSQNGREQSTINQQNQKEINRICDSPVLFATRNDIAPNMLSNNADIKIGNSMLNQGRSSSITEPSYRSDTTYSIYMPTNASTSRNVRGLSPSYANESTLGLAMSHSNHSKANESTWRQQPIEVHDKDDWKNVETLGNKSGSTDSSNSFKHSYEYNRVKNSVYRYRRTIVLSDTKMKVNMKLYLIRRMVDAGQIKNGFHLEPDDGNTFTLLSDGEAELDAYYKELSEMFECHFSETQLNISSCIENQFRKKYGHDWAINVLQKNKVVGVFINEQKLRVCGFSESETIKGAALILSSLTVAMFKSVNIKIIKKYANVESLSKEDGRIIYVTGLPRDVINALHAINCDSDNNCRSFR